MSTRAIRPAPTGLRVRRARWIDVLAGALLAAAGIVLAPGIALVAIAAVLVLLAWAASMGVGRALGRRRGGRV